MDRYCYDLNFDIVYYMYEYVFFCDKEGILPNKTVLWCVSLQKSKKIVEHLHLPSLDISVGKSKKHEKTQFFKVFLIIQTSWMGQILLKQIQCIPSQIND